MHKLFTWVAMSLPALLAGFAFAQPAPARFGVVALTAAHQPCVVLPLPAQVGDRITIAKLHPTAFVPARVRKPIAECGLGLEPGHAYELAIDPGQDDWWASTAVVGAVPPGLVFRDCSGTESIHLTVWRGTQRVWHGYYHVDHDLEPTCKPEEVAE